MEFALVRDLVEVWVWVCVLMWIPGLSVVWKAGLELERVLR